MIVVTGSVTAKQDCFEEVRGLSLEHVRRSRGDRSALLAHFAVPDSRHFVRALLPLAAVVTTIEIYDATRVENF